MLDATQIYDNGDNTFVIDKHQRSIKIDEKDETPVTILPRLCLKMFTGSPNYSIYSYALTINYDLYNTDRNTIVKQKVLNYFYDVMKRSMLLNMKNKVPVLLEWTEQKVLNVSPVFLTRPSNGYEFIFSLWTHCSK